MSSVHHTKAMLKTFCEILAIATLCGSIANALSPYGIAWYEPWSQSVAVGAKQAGIDLIDTTAVSQAIQQGQFIILDARPHTDYLAGHLPTALSFPADAIKQAAEELLPVLSDDETFIVYCSSVSCDDALRVGVFLKEQGFSEVQLYFVGYQAWRERGEAVETGP